MSVDNNNTYDMQPIEVSDSMLTSLSGYEHVAAVAPFITKPGMLTTDSAFRGMVLKGTDYWDFFEQNIVAGEVPTRAGEVVVSRETAKALKLAVGDAVNAYFVDETNVRARRYKISGIYETGFGQYDELFIIET